MTETLNEIQRRMDALRAEMMQIEDTISRNTSVRILYDGAHNTVITIKKDVLSEKKDYTTFTLTLIAVIFCYSLLSRWGIYF